MNNRDFDIWVRNSIEKMDGHSHVPANWENFESRVESEVGDEYFDQVIREKLTKGAPGYNPAHWLEYLYRASLDKLFKVDFLYNKLSEALLLGLALLWILPLGYHPPVETKTHPVVQSVPVGEDGTDRELQGDSDGYEKTDPIRNSPLATSAAAHTRPLEVISELISENNPGLRGQDGIGSQTGTADLQSSPARTLAKLAELRVKSGNDSDLFPAINLEKSTPHLSGNYFGFYQLHECDVELLSTRMPAVAVNPAGVNQLKNRIPLQKTATKSGSTVMLIFSSFVVADINTIHTPYDEIYQKAGYEQTKFGMGGGMTFGAGRNGWTVESGLIFSMKQYNPREVLEIFRFSNETARAVSLKSIELNTLSIPLSLRYDLFSNGRWIPFMKMGVGLNLATHANYQREEYIVALSSPIPDNANVNFSEDAKLDEKRFTDGLLQGGSFNENSYLSANVGLGVDFLLSPEWRMFAQGSYHYNFLETKLGPNNDHINSISLQMGVRHILKK